MGVEIWDRNAEEGDGWQTKKKKRQEEPEPENRPDMRDLPDVQIVPVTPDYGDKKPTKDRFPGGSDKDKPTVN